MITFKQFIEFAEDPTKVGTSEYIKKEEKKYFSIVENRTETETLEDGSTRQVDVQVTTGEREEIITTIYKYTLGEGGVINKQLSSPEELQKALESKQEELKKIQDELNLVQNI